MVTRKQRLLPLDDRQNVSFSRSLPAGHGPMMYGMAFPVQDIYRIERIRKEDSGTPKSRRKQKHCKRRERDTDFRYGDVMFHPSHFQDVPLAFPTAPSAGILMGQPSFGFYPGLYHSDTLGFHPNAYSLVQSRFGEQEGVWSSTLPGGGHAERWPVRRAVTTRPIPESYKADIPVTGPLYQGSGQMEYTAPHAYAWKTSKAGKSRRPGATSVFNVYK